MIVPIYAWEYQLSAEMIRIGLRSRQARTNTFPGIQLIDDLVTGTSWRVCECIGRKLGGEKLPR